ncbi:MAG: CPBP family intramembrane metalloprotease [Acidobacteria bacterium]|nr:CPBP family intramembrane metalloprotease [Acidobacteriota bacterium]
MDLTRYFLLPDGRLRAGWRLSLFVVFFLMSWFVVSGIASFGWQEPTTTSQMTIFSASALLATALSMRLLERQPFLQVGLAFEPHFRSELLLGLAGGAALVGAITLAAWAMGTVRFQPSEIGASYAVRLLLPATVLLAVSALTEELLFRGYPFQRLVEGANGLIAIAIFSILFGILHAGNPNATRFSILNTMLAGVLLSLGYLKTGSLWLPIGFHFSWNWTLCFLGLPVSGLEVTPMPWKVFTSPEYNWLHGGAYGPEGGLLATIGLFLAVLHLLRREKRTGPP